MSTVEKASSKNLEPKASKCSRCQMNPGLQICHKNSAALRVKLQAPLYGVLEACNFKSDYHSK